MASYACSLLLFEAARSYGKSSPAHQEVSEMGHALPASVQAKTPYFLYAFVPALRAGCRPLATRIPHGVAECGNSTCSPNDRYVDAVRRRRGGGGTPTALPANRMSCRYRLRASLRTGGPKPELRTHRLNGANLRRR